MDEVERELRADKNAFLDKTADRIDRYIVSTGKNCIGVVERRSDGSIRCTWDFRDDKDDLCKMVYLFMRKKRAKSGCELDSILTDPIVNIVQEEYQDFYQSQSENISNGILKALASDEIKLANFVDRISGIALQKLSKEARRKVVELVVHEIRDSVSQGSLHSVGHQVGHIATTTAGTQVAAVVAQLLIKALAGHIGAIVAKVLASAALQQLLVGLAKKYILAAVTAAVFQFLIAHFGAALAGASIMWVVIPIIAGYIAYKITTFPKELGEAVSKEVRKELDKNFDSINKTVLEKVFYAIFEGDELVGAVARDREFQDAMRTLGEKVEPGVVYFQEKKNSVSISVKEFKW